MVKAFWQLSVHPLPAGHWRVNTKKSKSPQLLLSSSSHNADARATATHANAATRTAAARVADTMLSCLSSAVCRSLSLSSPAGMSSDKFTRREAWLRVLRVLWRVRGPGSMWVAALRGAKWGARWLASFVTKCAGQIADGRTGHDFGSVDWAVRQSVQVREVQVLVRAPANSNGVPVL